MQRSTQGLSCTFKRMENVAKRMASIDGGCSECVKSFLSQILGLRDSKKLGVHRTALEVFMGHKPVRTLLRAIPKHEYETCRTAEEIRALQFIGVDTLQEVSKEMHRNAAETLNITRRKNIERHNRMPNVSPANFHIGDLYMFVDLNQNNISGSFFGDDPGL